MGQRINTFRFKVLRYSQNLKQSDMAKRLGVSQQTVSRLENHPDKMPVDLLILASQYFNVSLDYLLGLSDYKNADADHAKTDFPLDIYENLTSDHRAIVRQIARALLVTQNSLNMEHKQKASRNHHGRTTVSNL